MAIKTSRSLSPGRNIYNSSFDSKSYKDSKNEDSKSEFMNSKQYED
jgi:hypothetical protein